MTLRLLRKAWLKPLLFFQAYLSASVVLFFWGPWPWNPVNPGQLAAFLLSAQAAVAVGYLCAWGRVRRVFLRNPTEINRAHRVGEGVRFLRHATMISLILFIPTSLSRTGHFLPNVMSGLSNTGSAYVQNFERLASGNPYVVVEYLRMIFSPWLLAVNALPFVYWRSLSTRLRLACALAIAANLSTYVATGTNKGIADFATTCPWFLFLATSAGVLSVRFRRAKIIIPAILVFVGFLVFFGQGQAEREGGVGEFGVVNTGREVLFANASWLSEAGVDSARIIYESLTRYVSSGYYALSLSLQVDHPTTFGFGHSMFLARNADALFGTDYFSAQSLPGIVDTTFGWSYFALWDSIYPWIASDVGFTGAILVMGAFGYLLSLSWGRALVTLEHKWLTLVFLLLIFFYYTPANNQVFQSGETCVGFLLVAASIARRRFRVRHLTSASVHGPFVPRIAGGHSGSIQFRQNTGPYIK